MTDYRQVFAGLQLRGLVPLQWALLIGAYILIEILNLCLPTGFLPPESQYFFEAFPNLLGQLLFIGALWMICKSKGFSLQSFWHLPIAPQKWYWLGLLFIPLMLMSLTLNALIGYFIENFSYLPFEEASELNPLGMWIIEPWKSHWYLAYNFLSVFNLVLLTPFVEELFFRGFVLHRLSLKYGAYKGLFFSALFFGAFHLHGIGHATLIGLVLGFVYLQTRNLRVTIYWHMLHNGVSTLFSILNSDFSILDQPEIEHTFDAVGLGLLGIFLVCLPTGIRWLRQQRVTYTAPLFQEASE